MTDLIEGDGACLCGATSFTVRNIGKSAGACHCDSCRKWGGGPFMAVDCGTEISFKGEENISVYSSSEWADRGFCKQCGSHLFYRLKETQHYRMPVGLFSDQENFTFDLQVFIDEKPSFYCFADETTNLTGAELFAKFAPPEK